MPIPLMEPLRGQGPGVGAQPARDAAEGLEIEVDDRTGAVRVRETGAAPAAGKPARFEENLAERLDAAALAGIAEELLAGIEADERSRREMVEQNAIGSAASEMDAQTLCQMVLDTAEMLRTGTPPAGRKLRPVR